ncbi:MAG TPA: hypothetical protein VGM60_06510 [Pseudonocardia sp.]|jgi:hypothetical protein|uniref:hypothetical protein n=1 Tax=Pseudonocardia sp. TaxID=60912 RepID=UPI002F42E240
MSPAGGTREPALPGLVELMIADPTIIPRINRAHVANARGECAGCVRQASWPKWPCLLRRSAVEAQAVLTQRGRAG